MNTSNRLLVYPICATLGILAGCAPVPYPPSARHRQMVGFAQQFEHFDHDGDHFLTRTEVVEGLRAAGSRSLTPAELDRVMAAYDTNHDVLISYSEARIGASVGPEIFDPPAANPIPPH